MNPSPIRTLILTTHEATRMGQSLKEVLTTDSAHRFEVAERSCATNSTGDCPGIDFSILKVAQPHVIALCLSASALQKPCSACVALAKVFLGLPVILVAESGEPETLTQWLEHGLADFICTPIRAHDVLPRILRLVRPRTAQEQSIERLKERLGLQQFIGQSELLLQELEKIPKLARCDVSVLIGGETGTGKEMFARAIHHLSGRSGKPFMPVNCGTLPTELVENELFGHDAGAYTGASSSAFGLIHECQGGTLFLDEVDTLPLPAQVKLLRFLQEREYRPLGSRRTCKADVRVLAASNADFPEVLKSGRFRADLFYRLNVVPLSLPPLRRRKTDIPLLARHVVARYSSQLGKPELGFAPAALQKLMFYDWPGNVRELENVIERAIVLCERLVIQASDICLPNDSGSLEVESFKALKAKAVEDFEREYIQRVLQAHGGNITRAAQAANKHRRAFWHLMQKYQIKGCPRTQPSAPATE